MSPRPRTIPNEDILAATAAVIGRVGPARFTLADVAGEVGLSPATLVQRFGSKRGLLLALAQGSVGYAEACFAAVRAAHASPLSALMSAATEMTRHTRSPEEMANHLAFLQIDLSDPDFHRLAVEITRSNLAGYRALLEEAVSAGELIPCDTTRLSFVIDAIAGGALISWAILREGTSEAWVRKDLETLLEPYRREGKKRPARSKAKKATRRETSSRRKRR
jgi:AcrR family transcriptional regulator